MRTPTQVRPTRVARSHLQFFFAVASRAANADRNRRDPRQLPEDLLRLMPCPPLVEGCTAAAIFAVSRRLFRLCPATNCAVRFWVRNELSAFTITNAGQGPATLVCLLELTEMGNMMYFRKFTRDACPGDEILLKIARMSENFGNCSLLSGCSVRSVSSGGFGHCGGFGFGFHIDRSGGRSRFFSCCSCCSARQSRQILQKKKTLQVFFHAASAALAAASSRLHV